MYFIIFSFFWLISWLIYWIQVFKSSSEVSYSLSLSLISPKYLSNYLVKSLILSEQCLDISYLFLGKSSSVTVKSKSSFNSEHFLLTKLECYSWFCLNFQSMSLLSFSSKFSSMSYLSFSITDSLFSIIFSTYQSVTILFSRWSLSSVILSNSSSFCSGLFCGVWSFLIYKWRFLVYFWISLILLIISSSKIFCLSSKSFKLNSSLFCFFWLADFFLGFSWSSFSLRQS